MSTSAPTSGWSSSLAVASGYLVTVTPGAGGSVLMQWTADGTTWQAFTNDPISSAGTFAIPVGATYLRGLGIGAAGSFSAVAGPADIGTLTAAQAALLTQRGRRTARMRFGRADNDGVTSPINVTTVRTEQQMWRFPFDIYGWRIGFQSNLAADQAFSLCKYAIFTPADSSVTTALDLSGLNGKTPTAITFSGSSGATVPKQVATDSPGAIVWSDWVYDPIAANQILGVRTLWSNAGGKIPYSATSLNGSLLISYAPNILTAHWTDGASDRVTSWTSWSTTSSNADGNLSIPYIEVLTSRRVQQVAYVGDSHMAGQVDSGNSPLPPCWALCEAMSTPAVQFVPFHRGWGGKEAAGTGGYHDLYALDVINNHAPDILFYQAWSQNDTDQTHDSAEIALAMDIVTRCRLAGIVPVLVTGVPIHGGGTSMETARLALNTVIRSCGEIVSDRDAAISNNATPVADYAAAYLGSSPYAHPNLAGYAAYLAADLVAGKAAAGL